MKIKSFIRTAGAVALAVFASATYTSGQLLPVGNQTPAQTQAAADLADYLSNSNTLPPVPPGFLDYLQGIADGSSIQTSMAMPSQSRSQARPSDSAPAYQIPAPQYYSVIDLGTLGSGNQSYAYGINNAGTVVGASYIDNSYKWDAFEYLSSPMQDIALVTSGLSFNLANGINDSGRIIGVGSILPNGGLAHVLQYFNGSVVDLAPGLGFNCYATGINSLGQVAGYCYPEVFIDIPSGPGDPTPSQVNDAFLISGGLMMDLGTIAGFSSSKAYGVNDNGQVVGYSQNSTYSQTHAFVYSSGGPMVDLDSALGGTDYSIAYSINNSGQMVGVANNAFIYNVANGQMLELGALGDPANNYSIAYSINNSGAAVGSVYINDTGDNHAFAYPPGGPMVDLNSLIDPASGWDLQYATAINDAGQIAGYGINPAGQTHAFLLDPYITWIYTGFHQFDNDASVPSEFGNDDAIQCALQGTENNYGSDGRAITKHYGCALCSLASMLTSVPGFESITPVQLDAELVAYNGYKDGCNMYWPKINTLTGGTLTWVDSKAISASSTDQSALDQYLGSHCWGNRYRVILQLEANDDPNETHYVFVVGKMNGDWAVFDPGWPNAFDLGTDNPDSQLLSSLNGHLTGFKANGMNWVFTVTGVKTYQVNAPSSGSFSEVVHSPVELLVTDPNGNRVGYDPVAGTDVFEIPGASYTRDYPILDAVANSGGAGDTNGMKTVSIPAPLGGSYSTALIGTASGSYTFDSSIVWVGNSETDQTTTGTTDVGVITTNSVFVITPSTITSGSVASGMFSLSFTAQANVTYAVLGANSLLSTNWTSLTTVTATGTNATASVPISDPNIMFYRIVSQ